jgi:hypothetical protein
MCKRYQRNSIWKKLIQPKLLWFSCSRNGQIHLEMREWRRGILGPEFRYLSVIRVLMYLTNSTRTDIAFVVNLLARYNKASIKRHCNGVKNIFTISPRQQISDYNIPSRFTTNTSSTPTSKKVVRLASCKPNHVIILLIYSQIFYHLRHLVNVLKTFVCNDLKICMVQGECLFEKILFLRSYCTIFLCEFYYQVFS